MPLELLDDVVDFLCGDGESYTLDEIAESTRLGNAKSKEIVQILEKCGFATIQDGVVRIAGWLVPF